MPEEALAALFRVVFGVLFGVLVVYSIGGYIVSRQAIGEHPEWRKMIATPASFDLDGEATYRVDAAFLAWVAGGEPPVHRAERAVRALRVMDALYTSSRNGGATVPLAVS